MGVCIIHGCVIACVYECGMDIHSVVQQIYIYIYIYIHVHIIYMYIYIYNVYIYIYMYTCTCTLCMYTTILIYIDNGWRTFAKQLSTCIL